MKLVDPSRGQLGSDMGRSDAAGSEEPKASTSFLRSLPLFIASALFFALGGAVLLLDPTYGPGAFTLWALLLALGFVAAIGGVASWLLVEEPIAETSGGPRARAEKTPVHPVTYGEKAGVRPAPPVRGELGRPTPAVHDLGGAARAPPAPLPPSAASSRPAEWDEDAVGDAGALLSDRYSESISTADALRDLDGIEQELVPRTTLRSSQGGTA